MKERRRKTITSWLLAMLSGGLAVGFSFILNDFRVDGSSFIGVFIGVTMGYLLTTVWLPRLFHRNRSK